MSNETFQIEIEKYTRKTWGKSALFGVFLGLGIIVPGVSGSAIAVIFDLYDRLLCAIGNLFRKFKTCFAFLLPILLGAIVGVAAGFFTVKKLVEVLPFAMVGLFAGLMSGAFPAVKDELGGARLRAKNIALLIAGVLIPVTVGVVSALAGGASDGGNVAEKLAAPGPGFVLLCIPVGYAVGITQIVPGLSATAILMAIGWFTPLVESVSLTFWQSSPAVFWVYGGLALGFLLGLVTFSKLLTAIFRRARFAAYSLIVGLALGSVLSMFFNPDVYAVYLSWASAGVSALDLTLAIVLFAAGAALAYALVRSRRKRKESAEE